MSAKDEHVMEALGKARVVVSGGKVVEVGDPLLRGCPLAKRFSSPVEEFTPEAIRSNIEERISKVGMFTKNRSVLASDDFAVFGASELISNGLRHALLDAAVVACDGAGTVVATIPELVQGIGGRMSGLVRTTPIEEVIEVLEDNGAKVLDPSTATIDQGAGVQLAGKCGFKKVAVTVTFTEEAERIRKASPETLIFGVHLTGISKEDAQRLVAVADVVTGCASRWIREVAGKAALLQAGTSIPVFALTPRGKELIVEKLKRTQQHLLVKVEKLPFGDGKCPDPLV